MFMHMHLEVLRMQPQVGINCYTPAVQTITINFNPKLIDKVNKSIKYYRLLEPIRLVDFSLKH